MNSTFLFGSGADTDACSKLKSGQSFSEALLLAKYKREVSSLLGSDFSSFQLVYPNSTKVFVQTVNTYAKEAKGILDNTDIKSFIEYYADKKSVSYENVIKPKCLGYYRKLKGDKSSDDAVKNYFLKYAVFFDSLDEKFNSLRYAKPNDSAKRVMNAYTSIFVFMFKSLYKLEKFEWTFDNVFEALQRDYDINTESGSYYQLLKDTNIDCNVITTNYTNLAEKETGRKVTYLHGKLTWFEDLENLSIFDCTDDEERNHLLKQERIIPYILIPSGVKPLICSKQVKQFSDFIDKLDRSNELCVIGYRFNSEDNHINSIIAEWLRKDHHRMIYFNFYDEVDFNLFEWTKHFSINKFYYSEKGMKGLSSESIQNIVVDKDNSRIAFAGYIKRLKRSKK